MRSKKLGLRAWKDFYDQVWWMLVYLAIWWFLTVTIVFGPPAMLLLFKVADPRMGVWGERMTFAEISRYLIEHLGRGWKLWLMTMPLIALCVFNLQFYGGSENALALLTPVWLALLILSVVCMITIFTYAAIMEAPAGESFKQGLRFAIAGLPRLIPILLITLFIPFIIVSTIVLFAYPLTFIFPGVTALAMGRYILEVQNLEFPRPNEPTAERLQEKRS